MIGTRRLRNSRLRSYESLREKLGNRLPETSTSMRRIKVTGTYLVPNTSSLVVLEKTQNLTLDLRHATFVFPPDATPGTDQVLMKVGNTTPPPTTGPALVFGVTANSHLVSLNDALTVGNYYFVYDPQSIEQNAETTTLTRPINGELIKVIAYDEFYERYTVTPKFARSYANTAIAADVTDLVCENITIQGGTFVGKDASGFLAWIAAGYVSGLKFRFTKGINSRTAGIDAVTSRNVSFYRCSATGVNANPAGTGSGYAFLVDRCTDVTMDGCQAHNSRDGILLDCGTSAFAATDCFGYGTTDGFIDLHGGDNLNVTLTRCVGAGQKLQLGNGSWRKGCKNVTVSNCGFGEIQLWAGARSVTIENTFGDWVTLNATAADPNFSTPKNYPESCVFNSCTIKSSASINGMVQAGSQSALPTVNRYVGITFTGCQLEHTAGQCGFYTRRVTGQSDIYFSGCTLSLSGSSIKPGMDLATADDTNSGFLTVRWTDTDMIISDSRLVGAACDETYFWDNWQNNSSLKNKRGLNSGSLVDISEADDFDNVNWIAP